MLFSTEVFVLLCTNKHETAAQKDVRTYFIWYFNKVFFFTNQIPFDPIRLLPSYKVSLQGGVGLRMEGWMEGRRDRGSGSGICELEIPVGQPQRKSKLGYREQGE